MRKTQNQIFSHIAFKQFKEKLETRCQIHEINIIIQEESYTSKSSFLDDDILPVYQVKEEMMMVRMWNMNSKVSESNVDYTKHKMEKLSMQM